MACGILGMKEYFNEQHLINRKDLLLLIFIENTDIYNYKKDI